MYRLIISPQAEKELKKIRNVSHEAVKLALEEIREDPDLGKPLSRELTGRLVYKAGGYRIVYKINRQDKVVNVISAGHRAVAYN